MIDSHFVKPTQDEQLNKRPFSAVNKRPLRPLSPVNKRPFSDVNYE